MKKFFFGSCAAALCLPVLLHAQGPGASITGEVRDPSGAIIASAVITARNTGTNVVRTTVSDSAGVFLLERLGPASYESPLRLQGSSGKYDPASYRRSASTRVSILRCRWAARLMR